MDDDETDEAESGIREDQQVRDVTVAMETEPVVMAVRVDSAQAEAGQ